MDPNMQTQVNRTTKCSVEVYIIRTETLCIKRSYEWSNKINTIEAWCSAVNILNF